MTRPRRKQDDPAEWLVAHRGVPEAFPENSLTGLRAALDAGARFVEFDIQLTRDGVPVVLHDQTLARVGEAIDESDDEGSDEVGALEWKTLSTRTIGEPGRFGRRFEHERVPRLEDMLALVDRYPGVTAFVELKRQSLQRFGTDAVVEPVCAELRRSSSRCVPISFDPAALETTRSRGARTIGLGIKPWNTESRHVAERLAPDYLFIRHDRIPDGDDPFWPGDWQWAVYVVDDPASAERLRRRGAGLIETDQFPRMVDACRDSLRAGYDRP